MVVASTPHYLSELYAVDCAAPAVVHRERMLTYAELKARSLALAGALRARGIGRDSRVAVQLERGPDLIVTLLGVLAAGACYVPIERSHPAVRRAALLAAANPALLITEDPAQATTTATPGELIAAGPALPVPASRGAEDPTYIIFTSGSTGTPKGVVMPDGPLGNLLAWQRRQPGFSAPARTLQFTPAGFDVHFQELFHTLSCGGTLVLLSDAERSDAEQLLLTIDEQRVERLFMPYIALATLAEAAVGQNCFPQALREVVTAGEQLVITPALRTLFQQLPRTRLHNQYGPSETHVVTAHTLTGPVDAWPTLPPIGRPIDGVSAEIVNDALEPVAPGEPGELLLGGDCLATGYLDAQQTAARFVDRPDGRVYRTGDLVRAGSDGFEYLGRLDRQLKIRGHRVEPGEIEAAIAAQDGIAACAVGSTGTDPTNRALVAYVVPAPVARQADDPPVAWEQIWDSTYDLPGAGIDPTFDTRGWNSSYGGGPLPAEEMRAWVAETSQRIQALRPGRVLELGAGTGLIMHGLDGQFDHYCATDYSSVAVEHLRDGLARVPELAERVQVRQLVAHEAGHLAEQRFDTVVINSLTQHFGSLAYLERVLAAAREALAGVGNVFLGDVTALNTRQLYFASVALHDQPGLSDDDLLTEIARRAGTERELVIDPAYFYRLSERLPWISNVQINLKGSGYDNELARFRYDVVLEIGTPTEQIASPQPLAVANWESLHAARQAVAELAEDASLWLRGVPHVRLQPLVRRLEAARSAGAIDATEAPPGVDPLLLSAQLADERSLTVDTFFGTVAGHFDLLLRRRATAMPEKFVEAHRARPPASLASTPLDLNRFAELKAQLQTKLTASFPSYLIPTRYVPLAKLPTTASGKIDRARLPEPSTARPALSTPFVEPRSPLEQSLANAWCRVLELDAVGVDDNFFDIGGNSALSLRLVTEMSRAIAKPIPIVALFRYPTIAELAGAFAEQPTSPAPATSQQSVRERARAQRQALNAQRARRSRRQGGRS